MNKHKIKNNNVNKILLNIKNISYVLITLVLLYETGPVILDQLR